MAVKGVVVSAFGYSVLVVESYANTGSKSQASFVLIARLENHKCGVYDRTVKYRRVVAWFDTKLWGKSVVQVAFEDITAAYMPAIARLIVAMPWPRGCKLCHGMVC